MRGKYQGGMPDAQDYKPEAIGTAELEAGEPTQKFPEYGLELVPIRCDGKDIGERLVRRNGEFLSTVSDQYKLLPNERAVEAANDVAHELDAEPFHEWNSADFEKDWFIQLHDHVFQDQEARRVHALYAWPEAFDVGGGDEIHFGFAVHNSIDASMSFQVGLFTFRHACANMVTMGVNGQGMSFDQRDVIQWDERKHTKNMDVEVDEIVRHIKDILAHINADEERHGFNDVTRAYRTWREEYLEPEHVESIVRDVVNGRLAQSDVPDWIVDVMETLEEEQEERESSIQPTERAEIVEAEMPGDETVWGTYNDITEAIWHGGSGDRTRQRKNKVLHRTFQPAEGVR